MDRRAAAKQISPGALALGRDSKRLALKVATDAQVCGLGIGTGSERQNALNLH